MNGFRQLKPLISLPMIAAAAIMFSVEVLGKVVGEFLLAVNSSRLSQDGWQTDEQVFGVELEVNLCWLPNLYRLLTFYG